MARTLGCCFPFPELVSRNFNELEGGGGNVVPWLSEYE